MHIYWCRISVIQSKFKDQTTELYKLKTFSLSDTFSVQRSLEDVGCEALKAEVEHRQQNRSPVILLILYLD